MGGIVTWTIAEFVYPRISTRSLRVSLGEVGKNFGYHRLVEEETGGLPERREVALLAQCDELGRRYETKLAVRMALTRTFSANLAASLALGRVVLICSC